MPVPPEQIASPKLRDRVEALKREVRPATRVAVDLGRRQLEPSQQALIGRIRDIATKENALAKSNGYAIAPETPLWEVRVEMRQILQEAILADLLRVGIVERNVVGYGAIPDPATGWRHFKLPGGGYACWTCGTDVPNGHCPTCEPET